MCLIILTERKLEEMFCKNRAAKPAQRAMGAINEKDTRKLCLPLIERRLSLVTTVMIGLHTPLISYKGIKQDRPIKGVHMQCLLCRCQYDSESLWFYLSKGKSLCFVCYSERRIRYFLIHRLLCDEVLSYQMPYETAVGVYRSIDYFFLHSLIIPFIMGTLILHPIVYVYPNLQYNMVKHLDTEFHYFSQIHYSLLNPIDDETLRIRVLERDRCFYIYYLKRGHDDYVTYTKTTHYYILLRDLDTLLENCLKKFQYTRFLR